VAVPESLQKLLEEGVIDEIQRRLMSGKEASVYVVTHRGKAVAAKVYKARDRRSFKATSSYTEGRNQTRNTRDKRAMDRRSSYGKELMEDSWRDMEYRALTDAHYAGVRVPKAIMIYEDVLLMELLVDAEGQPAPRLADFDLSADEANEMFREVYRQVRLFLTAGRIHGDLSAFNILVAAGGPTLIDLPQVVDAAGNSQARQILGRDLRNVVEHLARFDERLLRFVECGDPLFHHYQRGTLEEAIEPREVRRVHSGGRRVSGQERAEGQVGQPRRGGPQRGPQQGGQRGPQRGGPPTHADRGPQRGGPPMHADRGPPPAARPDRGPPQAQRTPQHGAQAQAARGQQGPPRGASSRHDPASAKPDERGRRGPNAQPNDPRRDPRNERSGDPRQASRPNERSGDPGQASRPNERSADTRQPPRPNERNGDPRRHDVREAQRRQDTGAPRRDPRAPQRSEPQRSEPQRTEPRREEGPPGVTVERRRRR
jgi:RIO kinase 1